MFEQNNRRINKSKIKTRFTKTVFHTPSKMAELIFISLVTNHLKVLYKFYCSLNI